VIRIDARGLESPQPFRLVMEALCDMEPDDEILLILDREPLPLYRVLERDGYEWQTTFFEEDNRYEVLIRREPDE
jgi:TusA-related sulfurtransferase